MTIATIAQDGKPYVSTVYFAHSVEKNEIYFLSKYHREHSKHILNKNNVAVAIVDQSQEPSENKTGLQIQGVSQMIAVEEAKAARIIYNTKIPQIEVTDAEVEDGTDGHKLWKITPQKIKIWDESQYGGEGKILSVNPIKP